MSEQYQAVISISFTIAEYKAEFLSLVLGACDINKDDELIMLLSTGWFDEETNQYKFTPPNCSCRFSCKSRENWLYWVNKISALDSYMYPLLMSGKSWFIYNKLNQLYERKFKN